MQTYRQSARAWLRYSDLRRLSQDVASQLRGFGIGAQDRIAIVSPSPLNPSYQ
jgi:acyl-coenzyme A synthetase/AMP-(fatty) acid ligase